MMQLSLFSEDENFYQPATAAGQGVCKIINFSEACKAMSLPSTECEKTTSITMSLPSTECEKTTSIKKNRISGKAQKVYPIKKYTDLVAMANWLYQNKDPKYVLAFVIGINIGLRANELLSLRMNQVFNPDGTVRCVIDNYDTTDVIYVYQGKTDKNRPIFLNQACKDALEWYYPVRGCSLYSSKYLFPSREGGAIEVDTFRKVLKEAARANGIKENIGTHTLRKTFGFYVYTQSDEQHRDITDVQALYGHSDPEITMRYIGLDEIKFKSMYHKLMLNIIQDHDFFGHGKLRRR